MTGLSNGHGTNPGERIAALLSEIPDEIRRSNDPCISGEAVNALIRIREIYNSLEQLSGAEHYESAASVAALLFERYMDLVLLTSDEAGEMEKRYVEYINLQRFRSAHRVVSFKKNRGEETTLDAEKFVEYKELTGGIEKIRKRVAEIWGTDKGGKASYPVHWTGRKCTRVISSEMGVEYEELYIEAYAVLSWLLSCGLYENRDPAHETKREICDWAKYVGQLAALDAINHICDRCKIIDRPAWLADAVKRLRRNPGSTL